MKGRSNAVTPKRSKRAKSMRKYHTRKKMLKQIAEATDSPTENFHVPHFNDAIVNDQVEDNRVESTFSFEQNDKSSFNYQQKLIKNLIASDSGNSTKKFIQHVNNDCQLHIAERIGHISNDEGHELNHNDKCLKYDKEVPPVLVIKPNLIYNFNHRKSRDDEEGINNVLGRFEDLKCKNNSHKSTKSKSIKIVNNNHRGTSHNGIICKLFQNPYICDEDESVDELKNNTKKSNNIKDKHASENNQKLTRLIEELTEEEILGRYDRTFY